MDLIVAMEKLVGFVKQMLAGLTNVATVILTTVISIKPSASGVNTPDLCAVVIAEHSYVKQNSYKNTFH
jgi:hypothetical protein